MHASDQLLGKQLLRCSSSSNFKDGKTDSTLKNNVNLKPHKDATCRLPSNILASENVRSLEK